MERVLVIGSPGAGKSTFARALAARTGLPLIHLDAEYWRAGWTLRQSDQWWDRLAGLIAADRWVIDGNYGGSLPMRLERADTVIMLDPPTATCLWRVVRRWWRWRGRTRPDMTAGCPERLDPRFLLYTLRFRATQLPRNEAALAHFGGAVLRFRRAEAAADWLATVAPAAPARS